VAGYAAIIEVLALPVPIPNTIAVISEKYRRYEVAGWQVFTPKYQPDKTLYKQLVFALKYEGVNLLLFKKLFEKLSLKEVMHLLQIEPTGQYSRKIWFLYEWLMKQNLDLPDLSIKKAVPLIDEKLQYAISGTSSPRHRIINNLAGTPDFCPLIQRTEKLDKYIESNFTEQKNTYLKDIHKDILQRASAFLLLKDSKASFNIEGESPKSKRATRWGQAIGQAGAKPMSKEELLRLQQLVIQNSRFTTMGFRTDGGFVGEHDRTSGEPIPDHISARWQDAVELTEGLVNVGEKLQKTKMNAVLVASMMAFGFVFIHPFVDGNGRLHRYLIHHILATMGFSQQGIIFPVSASILDHMDDYRKVLESYSIPLLDFIEWKSTKDNNVEILNETIDYYRYYDVTAQTEFLYDCVHDAITNIIPKEVNYLKQYDSFKRFLDDEFEMPDKLVALIVRFLEQNNGKFSKRAEEKELTKLTAKEAKIIEQQFQDIFSSNLP
jgi:Fic family protein